MKCQFFLSLSSDFQHYLQSKLKGHTVKISKEALQEEKLDSATEVLGVFVDSKIRKNTFEKLPKLKLILTLSTGYDHIDLNQAKLRNIVVCNVPMYGENTVAEYTIALALALLRKLFQAAKRMKEGKFDHPSDVRGNDLRGKTVGIIGTGHIGAHVVAMCSGFNVRILAHDVSPRKELEKTYNVEYVPLGKLFRESNIISLHIPLVPETYHIINKQAIKKMKRGVYIINTARGGLINSEALVWGLEQDIVSGAGLDVLEDEDLLEDPFKLLASASPKDTRTSLMNNILIDHPRTIVTPHNAFNSNEAVKRIIDTSVENLKTFLSGRIQNNVAEIERKKKK